MALMTGQTLAAWRQQISQDSDSVLTLLIEHINTFSAEDNAWLSIASEAQLKAQLAALIPLYQNNPHALPLFGIPFAVKDNVDVAGWPTTAACPAF